MDVDSEETSKPQEVGDVTGKRPIVAILVGAPGSGKSTFCEHVMRSSTRSWTRVCQVRQQPIKIVIFMFFCAYRRLKPGGGGVNAAIFGAAGPALEVATKECAKSLDPGNAIVVPLPSESPLHSKEGVTHVIHVVGPNMNPQRPNCLNHDYAKGCQVLREAYTALFEGFASVVNAESESQKSLSLISEQKQHKRDGEFASVGNISKRRLQDPIVAAPSKRWGSWAQPLYDIAVHPEKHEGQLLEVCDDVVVLNDRYPKVSRVLHVLCLLTIMAYSFDSLSVDKASWFCSSKGEKASVSGDSASRSRSTRRCKRRPPSTVVHNAFRRHEMGRTLPARRFVSGLPTRISLGMSDSILSESFYTSPL
ncbi:Transcription factor bHLH140 [Linum grandiflorum]